MLARATNTGPLADGNPPTGHSLAPPGASFTQVGCAGSFPEQNG